MARHNQKFPTEMVFEILSRTSLHTLDRCKAVCKEWKQLIEDPNFMPLYCKRTNNVAGFVLQTIVHNEFVSTFVSIHQNEDEKSGRSWPCDGTKILASSNQGICCCERQKHRNRRYYVCKPTTQQWQHLPNPKLRFTTSGVAIVVLGSTPLRYKIVRLSYVSMNRYFCEVFDSETWNWRVLQRRLYLPDELISPSASAVSVGDFVYWLTTGDNVVSVNVSDERFIGKFSLPKSVHGMDTYCKQLVECEGRLGLSCVNREKENSELWLMEGPKHSKQWTKKMTVNCYPYDVVFYSTQIAFAKRYFEASFYKVQDCSFTTAITEVELGADFRYAHWVFKFRSDLDTVNLIGGGVGVGGRF